MNVRPLLGILAIAGALLGLSGEPAGEPALRVLQMNLCNSGSAGCYTGRSVAEAAALIRLRQPDVVTLNEICRSDVDVLARSFPEGTVGTAFQPAIDRRTLTPVLCRAGDPYGIGLLTRVSATPGERAVGGVYLAQDPANDEERAWPAARLRQRLRRRPPVRRRRQAPGFGTRPAAGPVRLHGPSCAARQSRLTRTSRRAVRVASGDERPRLVRA